MRLLLRKKIDAGRKFKIFLKILPLSLLLLIMEMISKLFKSKWNHRKQLCDCNEDVIFSFQLLNPRVAENHLYMYLQTKFSRYGENVSSGVTVRTAKN